MAPPERYKFKRTLKCSPAEMKRIEEAKRQRLAQEAEAATDVPPPSFQRYLDTYHERRAAAVAAAEARRQGVPKVQAECVGAGLKRPCDDSNSGTTDSSETHADSDLFVADYSSLEVPSPKLVHEDPNPTTASGDN
ncbi:hypothetical protein Tco_1386082 [Tanacetum coccineum]|uniref:Uncharacterized protein n=1 Tax=Tanacetum coccineum TaxID=301880 RepID=A0ABQ5ETJ0_9ASTR